MATPIISDDADLKHLVIDTLKKIESTSPQTSADVGYITCHVLFGKIVPRADFPDELCDKWYDRIRNTLLQLHKERLVVFGYKNDTSCHQLWYVCPNPPSERRCFGNFNGHGEWWATYDEKD